MLMLKQQHKQAIQWLYFLSMLVVAFLIKHWYSQAALLDMQWMMRPLAMLLEVFLDGDFYMDAKGQWYNPSLHIILVKACSGLNFFVASFVVLAIAFYARVEKLTTSILVVCIASALLFAWPITLLANTLRIVIAMYFIQHPEILQWTQLDNEQIHRLVGLGVYFPLLVCQLQLFRAFSLVVSYMICAVVVVSLLIIVPLLTGNAFSQLEFFIEHILAIFAVIFAFGLICAVANMAKYMPRHAAK